MPMKEKWTPHDYQLSALKLMVSQGSVGLFLDPGLGKTSVVLAGFKVLRDKGLVKRMLIIAPLRPCYAVWPAEIEKWENFSDITYVILHGNNKEAALAADADVYIINPEGLEWLFSRNSTPEFSVLCVDESTKFKNSTSKRFKILRNHITKFKRRWILTGTPVPNGITDLFGQIFILDMGRSLGRFITHFRNKYLYRPGYSEYEWALRPGAFEDITHRIAPLIYQLTAEDYLKMPELICINIEVELPPEVRKIYESVESAFIAEIEGDELVAANTAVAGGKCRQIANGAVYIEDKEYKVLHSEKLDALEDLLEELNGNPTLLLYEFNHDRDRILERFGDIPAFSSGITGEKMAAMVADFNAGKIPILLGHPASMGHGLNLQGAASHVIWFGITWNLEHYDQAIRRVYRQGQKNSHVFIYHIIAKNTIDERVAEVLKAKDHTQKNILNTLKSLRHATITA